MSKDKKRWINKTVIPKNRDGSINTDELVGISVPFSFEGIEGELTILEYVYNERSQTKTRKDVVYVRYKDRELYITLYNLMKCNIQRVLRPIAEGFTIGEGIGDFVLKDITLDSQIDRQGSIRTRDRLLIECKKCKVIRSVRVDHVKHIHECSDCKRIKESKLSIKPKRSLGENIFSKYLDHIGEEYEQDISFEWSDRRRFDFYLPNYRGGTVVEVHGIQHYEEQNEGQRFHRRLQEQQRIDKWKKDKAISMGYHYIEVDARESTLPYISDSIMESEMPTIDIPWDKIYYEINNDTELIDELIRLYNDDNRYTLSEMSSKLKVKPGLTKKMISDMSELGLIQGYDNYEILIRYHEKELRELYRKRKNDSS